MRYYKKEKLIHSSTLWIPMNFCFIIFFFDWPSQVIRARVKELMIPRYKVVVLVHIGQLTGQSMKITSRCLWDASTDTFASYSFKNSSLCGVGTVFAVYLEWIVDVTCTWRNTQELFQLCISDNYLKKKNICGRVGYLCCLFCNKC